MPGVLYLIGVVVIGLGSLLIVPALKQAFNSGNPLFLLGAPLTMSGINLILAGFVILGVGEIVRYCKGVLTLLSKIEGGIQNASSTGAKEHQQTSIQELMLAEMRNHSAREASMHQSLLQALSNIKQPQAISAEQKNNFEAVRIEKDPVVNVPNEHPTGPKIAQPVQRSVPEEKKPGKSQDVYWSAKAASFRYPSGSRED